MLIIHNDMLFLLEAFVLWQFAFGFL